MNIHKESEYTIFCSRCGESDSVFTGDGGYQFNDTPSRYFKRQGWRDIDGKTLCPECVKKIKK